MDKVLPAAYGWTMNSLRLVWLGFALGNIGLAAPLPVFVAIKDATSPDGAFSVSGVMEKDSTCRVEVRSKGSKKLLGQLLIPEYFEDDKRYSMQALWKEDSKAVALNIDKGRNIEECRFLAKGDKAWSEVKLPKKVMSQVQKLGDYEGGKAQSYLTVSEWMPGNKVKVSYMGNTDVDIGIVFRLAHEKGQISFEHLETIMPKEESGPKRDVLPCKLSILAGSGEGEGDKPLVKALFKWPSGVAVDQAGNVFVGDRGNHTLRRISANGEVTTVAGMSEKYGVEDGKGDAARFWYPQAVVLDKEGNAYVADTSSNRVRKVTPEGVVTTLVKDLKYPTGLAVDKNGDVFVADSNNHVVRKITHEGKESIFAGKVGVEGAADGPQVSATLRSPMGVAVTPEGVVYVAERKCIRRIDNQGNVTTFAGSPTEEGATDGTGSEARFWGLTSLTLDASGNLYVADHELKMIRQISPTGVVKTLQDPAKGPLPLVNPLALAFDAKEHLYVADQDAQTILKIELIPEK